VALVVLADKLVVAGLEPWAVRNVSTDPFPGVFVFALVLA